MALNNEQIKSLEIAITEYNFPAIYFEFDNNKKIRATGMPEVEKYIHGLLTSEKKQDVKYGLANVLYWGYGQMGIRDTRVNRFFAGITDAHIQEFQNCIAGNGGATLQKIRNIHMPEYSGISFVSKILTFLNPVHYCVLDNQILNIQSGSTHRALSNIRIPNGGTQIIITAHNEGVYNDWRAECKNISAQYYDGKYRAVDIERGFFNFVQQNDLSWAQKIYADF